MHKGLNIGLFFIHKSFADNWFKEYIKSIGESNILRYIQNGLTPHMLELKDGTVIRSYNVKTNPITCKVDKAYIEYCIDADTVDSTIRTRILK